LLLVQSKALDEAPYKLFGAIVRLAGITFWSLAFSYWFDKYRFLAEGRLATVLIIPSSWGSQLGASTWHHQTTIRNRRGILTRWVKKTQSLFQWLWWYFGGNIRIIHYEPCLRFFIVFVIFWLWFLYK
jgi:hypothetical protein